MHQPFAKGLIRSEKKNLAAAVPHQSPHLAGSGLRQLVLPCRWAGGLAAALNEVERGCSPTATGQWAPPWPQAEGAAGTPPLPCGSAMQHSGRALFWDSEQHHAVCGCNFNSSYPLLRQLSLLPATTFGLSCVRLPGLHGHLVEIARPRRCFTCPQQAAATCQMHIPLPHAAQPGRPAGACRHMPLTSTRADKAAATEPRRPSKPSW